MSILIFKIVIMIITLTLFCLTLWIPARKYINKNKQKLEIITKNMD